MDLTTYFIFIITYLSLCKAFNFETRLPIIKRGSQGSYFGFSVAEHQEFDEVKGVITNSWLLVGAPLDQNKQPLTNHSGALWRCPITSYTEDCDQVTTDGRRYADGHYEANPDDETPMPPLDDEMKDGQWLGVTVRSQGTGGKVMVCAHRYIRKGPTKDPDYMYGKGLCYTLSQMLDYDNTWEPCKGRPDYLGHEQYGFCQSGISGVLVNDTAVIGSPGPIVWHGTIFVISVSDNFLDRDKTVYYSPHKASGDTPVTKDSYLGMSVAAADFFHTGSIAFATGAPRSKGTGEVLLFVKDRPSMPEMKEKLRLAGEMFTSNFGYELATADVNGDKLPDLIVGAPNYFDKDVGGAVYVYVNSLEKCSLACSPPMKITGQPESRFGIAIANLGDINKDGYDDIAVGAPYENKGVVYIYLGSKNGTVHEPSQVILGEEFGLETFGYSLSGGLDMDINGYPDLLIGAFESEAVVLLRTRPIIEITSNVGPSSALKRIDPTVPGCNSELTCFVFEACISVQDITQGRKMVFDSEGLRLNCTLQTDINRRVPRVFIGNQGTSRPSTFQKEIVLKQHRSSLNDSTSLRHCQNYTVFVKEETKDIQSAIAMRLSYKLIQKEPDRPMPGDPLPSMGQFPILNQVQADKVFYATFLKDCGDNDICESQLSVDASLNLPTFRGHKKYDFILGDYKEIQLNVTVHNFNESAYESCLIIKHSPSISYVAQVKVNRQTCGTVSDDQVECTLGNPLARNEGVNVVLRFEPRSSNIEAETEVKFELTANTTSELLEPQGTVILTALVIKKANLTMTASVRPEELLYGGQVRGESEMKFKDQLGSLVRHTYQVINNGPSPVSNMEIVISWPFQVANNKPLGKWLLYMDEEPSLDAEEGGACDIKPGFVNPLGLHSRNTDRFLSNYELNSINNSTLSNLRRRRREVEMIVRKSPDNVVRMNCTEGTAKCFTFRCVVYKLKNQQSATVTIKARLWNSTLVEDYPKVKAVEIASHAIIHIPAKSGIIITSNQPADTTADAVSIARTGVHPDQQASGGLEIWMIVVAVLLGLLLVLLVAIGLWKCGFFKRTRPDPTLSGNLEKHTVDDYHDY